MLEGRPSHTAASTAFRRATHQLLDRPVVLDDPVALKIIDPEARARLEANPRREEGSRRSRTRRLRAFLAVRSRVAEDALARLVGVGLRQYVVLGAGLDTFAYRNPWQGLRVFEVDHPATQAWKRQRLQEGGIALREGVRYVPVDFERSDPGRALAQAGFDADEPAFFSWLGVTIYLDPAATWATLGWVGEVTRSGGGIAFDYTTSPRALGLLDRLRSGLLALKVKRSGEPFRAYFEPSEVVARLSALGFGWVEDLSPADLHRRYFADRADGLTVGRRSHVVTALHRAPEG